MLHINKNHSTRTIIMRKIFSVLLLNNFMYVFYSTILNKILAWVYTMRSKITGI